MNGLDNPIIFYSASFIMLLFAVLTLCFKNIFYSLISAIVVFFFAGLFFYLLGSEYNAVIQIAIYGVAIPVVLGLAIMFTNFKKEKVSGYKFSKLNFILILTAGLFILSTIYLIMTSLAINPIGFEINYINNTANQVINAFAHNIFVKYVWAFEIVSLILTIAIAGLTIFKREEEECKK